MSLVPSLLQAVIGLDGEALVIHVGEKPYVVAPSGQVELATRALTFEAVTGILEQMLPAESRQALEEFGAIQYELPPLTQYRNEHFTVVAARGGDDVWVEVRRRRASDDDAVPADIFATPAAVPAHDPVSMAAEDSDLALPDSAQLWPDRPYADEPRPAVMSSAAGRRPGIDLPDSIEIDPPVVRREKPADAPKPPKVTLFPIAPRGPSPEREPVAPPAPPVREPVVPPVPPAAVAPLPTGFPDFAAELAEQATLETIEEEAPAAPPFVPPPATTPPVIEEPIAFEPIANEPAAFAPSPFEPAAFEPAAFEAHAIDESASAIELSPIEEMAEQDAEPVELLIEPEVEPPFHPEKPEPIAPAFVAPPPPPLPAPPPPEPPSVSRQPITRAAFIPPPPREPEPTIAPPAEPEPVVAPPPRPPDPVISPPRPEPIVVAPPPRAPEPEPIGVAPPPPPMPAPEPMVVASVEREEPPHPAVVLPMSRVPLHSDPGHALSGLDRLLRIAAARGASTLYIASKARPSIRVNGEMQMLDEPALGPDDVESLLIELMPDRNREALRTGGGTEWICDIADVGRVSCMSFRDHRGAGGIFRMTPMRAISAEQLGLSREIRALATESEGLVLITGPRASGKSTLLQAFVDLINRTRRVYVVTIESEIRVVHESRHSLVSQREARDDREMLDAARAALREEPDVLLIEEMRTADLIALALDAAGSGRLVIGTVPGQTAIGALEHIVAASPAEERRPVQLALAENLRGIVAQVLVRKPGGGQMAARELLLNSSAIASLIAEGKLAQIGPTMESGRKYGMVPLNDALVACVKSGEVDAREAYRRAADRVGFLALLKRQGIDTTFVERPA